MSCEIHRYHRPKVLRTENHHVIPRAWQKMWVPPGYDEMNAPALWASATVALCPTSHSNVHVLLVKFMREYERAGGNATDSIIQAHKRVIEMHGRSHELRIAMQAPELFIARGGNLDQLISNKNYGYGAAVRPD